MILTRWKGSSSALLTRYICQRYESILGSAKIGYLKALEDDGDIARPTAWRIVSKKVIC